MILKIFKKSKKVNSEVDPDEIFLDSKNLPNFDRQQFEGRIEKPIPKKTVASLGIFFLIITLIFGIRLSYLQIQKGDAYRKRSENNILKKVNIFTERGIIYDRNKKELAWNKRADLETEPQNENPFSEKGVFSRRAYMSPGFSHVLGYVSYPAKDEAGHYWQNEFEGIDGLEKKYQSKIKGENGSKIIEINALGDIQSENIINAPKRGSDLVTSIDSRVQKTLFSFIKNLSENNNFTGGAGIIMDVRNGEIITATSFPEYDSEILSLGKDSDQIAKYINDRRKFFLDRTVSGLYTPGSIVKPFFALGALTEGVIDPYKKILSTGSISIPNPYFPDQKSVFKDWRAHGWTDMAQALAVSSDVYFYTIGGGFGNQGGLGVKKITDYARHVIKMEIKMSGIKDVEVEMNSHKTRLNRGKVSIIFDGYLDTDYEHKWEQKPMLFVLRTIFDKWIYKSYMSNWESELVESVNQLYSTIKGFLNLYSYKSQIAQGR